MTTVSLAMAAVGALHRHLDLEPVSTLPGCWEVQVDRDWWFAVNGLSYDAPCSRDIMVPPKHLVVTWRQFPVATCSRYNGDWVNRPGVTEDAFIKAVKRMALSRFT
jgi:hypothetical protein